MQILSDRGDSAELSVVMRVMFRFTHRWFRLACLIVFLAAMIAIAILAPSWIALSIFAIAIFLLTAVEGLALLRDLNAEGAPGPSSSRTRAVDCPDEKVRSPSADSDADARSVHADGESGSARSALPQPSRADEELYLANSLTGLTDRHAVAGAMPRFQSLGAVAATYGISTRRRS